MPSYRWDYKERATGWVKQTFLAVGWNERRLALALVERSSGRDDAAAVATLDVLANIFD